MLFNFRVSRKITKSFSVIKKLTRTWCNNMEITRVTTVLKPQYLYYSELIRITIFFTMVGKMFEDLVESCKQNHCHDKIVEMLCCGFNNLETFIGRWEFLFHYFFFHINCCLFNLLEYWARYFLFTMYIEYDVVA